MADTSPLQMDEATFAASSPEDLAAIKQEWGEFQVTKATPPARGPDDPPSMDFDTFRQSRPEDLAAVATEWKWSPYIFAQENPDKLDDESRLKLAKTEAILIEQGWKLSDIPLKTVITALPTLVAGMGTYTGKSLTAAISPIVEATGYLPEGEAMKVGAKEMGEVMAGTELAATTFADLFRKGYEKFGRFTGISKPVEEWTDADALEHFNKELEIRNQFANIAHGEGESTKYFGGQTLRDLKASGVKLDPEEITKSSHGDPFTFAAFSGGFHILNATTGKVVGYAASKSAAVKTIQKLQILKGTEKAAEKLAVKIKSPENIAAAEKATTDLVTARAESPLLSKAVDFGEKVSAGFEKLPTATGIIGKGVQATGKLMELGGKLSGAPGVDIGLAVSVAHGNIGALAVPILRWIAKKTGPKIAEFGKGIATPGAAGGTWTRAIQDAIKVPGIVTAGMAKGLPADLAFLAAIADTPEDARNMSFMATAFGGVGGLIRAAGGFAQGQQIAKRPWGTSSSWQKSYGTFEKLDAAHAEAMKVASPGVRDRIGALRDLAEAADTEYYQFTGPKAFEDFLIGQGWDAVSARDYAAANGTTLAELKTDAGGTKKVNLIRDPISGPHEVGHPILSALDVNQYETLLKKVTDHYGDEQVIQRAGEEASALATTPEAQAAFKQDWVKFLLEITGQGPAVAAELVKANPELASKGTWDAILDNTTKANLVKRYAATEILADTVGAVLEHGTPELLQDAKFPGYIARVLSKLMILSGADPYAGVTAGSTALKEPVVEAVRSAVQPFAEAAAAKKPVIQPARPVAGLPRPAPTPGGIPATPEAQKDVADEARAIADSAPAEPTIRGQRSQKELLGELADAIAQRVGVVIDYSSAKDAPAGALGTNRKTRRTQIEQARHELEGAPKSARALWPKNFFPERVLRTPGGTLQVLGWAPEVFAANAHKVAQSLAAKPELSPYPIDGTTKTFTTEGWKQLYEDTQTFVKNQMGGRTGAGGSLVVPAEMAEKGFFKPQIEGEAVPLDQRKADFINLLFGMPLPETPRITGGKLPLSIAGQEVSAATLPGRISVPVEPRAPFAGKSAEKLGIAGREILEVNPVRAAIEQAGIKLPGLIEAMQRLNAENIKEVAIAPEQPQFRGNVLTLTAGFMPKRVGEGELTPGKRKIEIEGPDGKRYPAIFDGYQDMTPMDEGFIAQITPTEGLPFQGDAKRSTTYLPRLQEEGYKVITELPTPEQWETERAAGRKAMFQPKKKKPDPLKFTSAQLSKAWILPGGEVEQLGSVWHHDWLDQNKAVQEKYGLKVPAFKGGDAEGVRESALKKGFSRVNMVNGTLTVEARQKDWKNLRPIVEDLIERNIDDVYKFRVNLFDDGINKVQKSFNENIFELDTTKEKMDKVFETFSELPQTEIGAQFHPKGMQEILDKIEDSIHCDASGSCRFFAGDATKTLLDAGIKDFKIIEGYVKQPEEDFKLQHTWIELSDGTKVDPTFEQFEPGTEYSGSKKSYTPEQYLEPNPKDEVFLKKHPEHKQQFYKRDLVEPRQK